MTSSNDPTYARRIAIAIALSVAVHEIVAGLARWPQRREPTEVVARVERVTIARRTPAPTPVPTPHPTPPPIVETPKPMVRFTVAPQVIVEHDSAPKAAAIVTPHRGGAAAPHHVAKLVPHPQPAQVASVQDGTNHGVANGGAGTGGGAGSGTGGDNGSSNGTGGTGTGNGDPTAPCGSVDFHPLDADTDRGGAVLQEVSVTVELRNGTQVDGLFPYRFKYPSRNDNPFVNDSLLVHGGVPVQFPPPGFDVARAPVAVQLVLKFSDPTSGYTQLPKCPPGAAASPAG
jgi:hypothetical protein